ncbi:MAG TPA: hypothetical protein VM512_04315 [Burkholderiaceae bacterium]|nr:hypothetical protein [Burkholderiaceae bacterium]
MDPLIIDLVRQYVYMVVLACVATAVAFFWRRPVERNLVSTGAIVVVVLMAAVFMLVVSLATQVALGAIRMPPDNVTLWARVVIPLAAGFWFAQSRLRTLWTRPQ